MKHLRYILILFIITSCQTKKESKILIVDDPINKWNLFESSNQAFTIEFPTSEIKRQAGDYFDNENIKRKSTAMRINLQDSINKLNFGYSASFVNFNQLKTGEFQLTEFYNWQKEHFKNLTGNDPIYDKQIELNNRIGREMQFEFKNHNSIATYRLIVKDSTYYLLQVLTSKEDSFPLNKATRKFFDSFEFINDK
ncbi:hypothetical protein SAMN05444411_1252 [Lutibacter oricola]|uniref:Lipoprotein n=1 Tax=Lutibacter oricola TaxID=762486 RepID=A0A1H3H5Y0_9FLAO|nr:hypothetical protein [Lutibacter oricola]SDY10059.1 hypothetical protein SAMN05444411_1252 [Lutibacter oricola]